MTLPEGGRISATDAEKYSKPDGSWFRDALRWDASPVDLSFLNAADRPAGRHGFVKADGDRLVFEDSSLARFWGANLAGPVLFGTPRENIPRQARRIAQLGYNLIRIHQEDANWVQPNIFGTNARDTRHLDRRSLDAIDYWVKCLKDEGVYVWLDLYCLRDIKPGDGVSQGREEIARAKGIIWGFNYINPQLIALMKEFQHQYLSHVNRYTGLAYKDDPAVIGVLITNENDLTFHYGLSFLADHNNPVHKALFDRDMAAFARTTGLPADKIWRSWEPGPSKYLLNELEHRFNRTMIDALRADGLKSPIATTNLWGVNTLFSLPALTDGDVLDVHSYGKAEALSVNPHYEANFLTSIASAHVHGKPLVITEWNVEYPEIDRFTAPLYVASIASLQGWDAPMLYNYSQMELQRPGPEEGSHRINKWSTFYDPALTGVMPAAAIAFRRGHISPARTSYCLKLSPAQLFETMLSPELNTATIRSLIEQSRLTIGMPAVKELPWLKPSETSGRRHRRDRPGSRPHSRRSGRGAVRYRRTRAELGARRPDHRHTQDPGRQWLDRRQGPGPQGRELPVQDEEGRGRAFEHRRPAAFVVPIHPDHGRGTGPPQPCHRHGQAFARPSARASAVPVRARDRHNHPAHQDRRPGVAFPWS